MVGDNLSSYLNLEYFTGASPEEIKLQLEQIRMPYKIIAMYSQGTNHVAWVSHTNKISKKKVTKKKKNNLTVVDNAKVEKDRS